MKEKTIDYLIAAAMGISIGCIHGLVMWATMNTGYYINEGGLGGTGSLDWKTAVSIPASYFLYSDNYTLPLQVAAIADSIGLIVVMTQGLWVPKITFIMEELAKEIKEGLQSMAKEEDEE